VPFCDLAVLDEVAGVVAATPALSTPLVTA
jgi:hypothetical protein